MHQVARVADAGQETPDGARQQPVYRTWRGQHPFTTEVSLHVSPPPLITPSLIPSSPWTTMLASNGPVGLSALIHATSRFILFRWHIRSCHMAWRIKPRLLPMASKVLCDLVAGFLPVLFAKSLSPRPGSLSHWSSCYFSHGLSSFQPGDPCLSSPSAWHPHTEGAKKTYTYTF